MCCLVFSITKRLNKFSFVFFFFSYNFAKLAINQTIIKLQIVSDFNQAFQLWPYVKKEKKKRNLAVFILQASDLRGKHFLFIFKIH